MPEEPATASPDTDSNKKVKAQPADKSKLEVEYDDFGLPIRKPRPRTPVDDSSDSGEEKFEDAVASKSAITSKSASREVVVENGTVDTEKKPENLVEGVKGHENTEPTVNGHKEEDKEKMSEAVTNKEKEEGAAEPKEQVEKAAEGEEETQDGRPRADTVNSRNSMISANPNRQSGIIFSEYSHQQLAPQPQKDDGKKEDEDAGWQTMPAYAHWDMYNDDNKLIAKENAGELEDMAGYGNVGGAAKGYTRVTMDDDVESQTSMDENTAYLFKEKSTALYEDEEDEAARDPLAQMQTTKNLLTEGQRIAYVGLVRLAMVEMENDTSTLERNRNTKKIVELSQETTKMWAQKMMVRLYSHMEIDSSEQIMIEQLQAHGVVPADLTPALMQNARVKNPAAEEEVESSRASISSSRPESRVEKSKSSSTLDLNKSVETPPPPPYEEHTGEDLPAVRTPSQLPQTKNIDIDLRWTILCDLFLVLIADSVYDSRSRQLLEQVGKYLVVDWLEICRFEKRVTDALEMQEEANKENWNEDEHMEDRRKRARNRRLALMGLATVGGSLVIGLSAGLLAPVIGAGLAAGFTTIGVAGTGGFLAGAGGAAIITTTGVVSGGTIAVRAANRRTGSVKTFEYRPLHNNKRVNLIVTIAGWMNGKVDDVRLPYSTVDPIMGDMYSVLWEPEMLRSMGDTINILATEVNKFLLCSN